MLTNENTKKQSMPAVVLVLCILTIIGSVFGLIRCLLYEVVADFSNNTDYWRGYAFIICHLSTLTAAIIMLTRKVIGFWIYLASQIIYIGLIIYTLYSYSNFHYGASSDAQALSYVFTLIFSIPSVIMLVLYLVLVRIHLN
ncbi:MAG: hypothetical protein H0U95_18345 [Bacteroidetes bacterium]|nr:hypothetical protein [Bacteroidota bacterium]